VKLNEAGDPASKFKLGGLLARFYLNPPLISSSQPTVRGRCGASGWFNELRALNRLTPVESKDILQSSNLSPHHRKGELPVVRTVRVKIDAKELQQLIQLVSDELDVPTNGLDRSAESPALVAAGRSLSEPAIQQLYRDYVTAMDTLIHPDYLGLASETNLIRAIAPASLYNALVAAAGGAATSVALVDSRVKLYTTVQVETAWGKLAGPGGAYVGIDQDLADFGFINALGLSSYPYLGGFTDPDSIPLDY
jgi:hypothetical protein